MEKTIIVRLCDLEDGEVEATDTIEVVVDGTATLIDVCDEHAQQVRDTLASVLQYGRRGARRRGTKAAGRARRGAGREAKPARAESRGSQKRPAKSSGGKRGGRAAATQEQVRAWARENGLEVAERGRLAASVFAAYEAAH